MFKKQTAIFIILLILLANITLIASVITDYTTGGVSPNPICTNPGVLTYAQQSLSGSTTLTFEQTTNYFDSKGDSAPLLVSKGTNGWKFSAYTTNQLASYSESECSGTGSTDLIKLLGIYLILKDQSSNYKLCVYNPAAPTAAITSKTLDTSASTISSIIQFLPYFISSANVIYAAVSDGTDTAILSFDTTVTTPSITGALVGTKQTAKALTSIHGNDNIFYSHLEKVFLRTSDWGNNGLVIDSSYSAVNSYRLRLGYSVVTLSKTDGTAGAIYSISGSSVSLLNYNDATTTAFLDFSDEISNFFRVGSTSVYWYHLTFSGTSILSAKIPISELTTGTIQNVALSGNKAIMLWSTKIIYLKITGNDSVKKIFEKSSPGMTLNSEYQYILKLSCLCQNIKRLICFADTLNCLIMKKGSNTCGTQDVFVTA